MKRAALLVSMILGFGAGRALAGDKPKKKPHATATTTDTAAASPTAQAPAAPPAPPTKDAPKTDAAAKPSAQPAQAAKPAPSVPGAKPAQPTSPDKTAQPGKPVQPAQPQATTTTTAPAVDTGAGAVPGKDVPQPPVKRPASATDYKLLIQPVEWKSGAVPPAEREKKMHLFDDLMAGISSSESFNEDVEKTILGENLIDECLRASELCQKRLRIFGYRFLVIAAQSMDFQGPTKDANGLEMCSLEMELTLTTDDGRRTPEEDRHVKLGPDTFGSIKKQLRDRYQYLRGELRAAKPMPPGKVATGTEGSKRKLYIGLGATGIGVGLAAAGLGAWLIAIDGNGTGTCGAGPGSQCSQMNSTLPGGVALAVGGGVAVAAGVTALVLGIRMPEKAAVTILPAFGPNSAGLVAAGHF